MLKGASLSSNEQILEVLTKLKSHFNQHVHRVEEEPPHFDSLLGKPINESPVVTFWLERLVSLPNDDILHWIAGYEIVVHELLREPGCNPLPVLQNYEWILSQWLDDIESCEPKFDSCLKEIELSRIVTLISKDILFALKISNDLSKYLRCNVMIPTLFRILHHITRVGLWLRQTVSDENLDHFVTVVICILPFLKPCLDPPAVDTGLLGDDANDLLQSLCIFPPLTCEIPSHQSTLLSIRLVEWTNLTSDGSTIFCDTNTGITLRAAEPVITSLVALLESDPPDKFSGHENDNEERLTTDRISRNCDKLMRHLGLVRVARAVHSRFFGKDSDQVVDTPTQIQIFQGRQTTRKTKPLEEKVYKVDPSVIHILLNFVRLVGHQDKEYTGELVSQIIPCCLELLDSANSTYSALGASALNHFLRVLETGNLTLRSMDKRILSQLESASKVHNEGPSVIVIGQSQVLMLQWSKDDFKMHVSVCKQWLINLQQATRRSSGNASWELLVGGVIPLLHAIAKSPDARGIEIGRLGLSVLLPLVAGEFVDIRTQTAATVALINLLIAAYPIMPHHGGKILCGILASFSTRSTNHTDDLQDVRSIALHAAALCLVVCGSSAYRVIDGADMEKDKYQMSFLSLLSEVRGLAASLENQRIPNDAYIS